MRDILAAAARLHDIGNLINYYSHARHSCYMTANAHIFGWTHSEQVMCALICAFHHGYSGKYLKANGQAHILTAAQMRQVRILSLFLAMAEGLDESQEHCITRVICTSYKAAMDLRVYTDRENFDVPAHATASLVKDFEKHSIFPCASSGSLEAATGMSSSKQHKSYEKAGTIRDEG